MTQETQPHSPLPRKHDRIVKGTLILLAVGIGAVIYYLQLKETQPKGDWLELDSPETVFKSAAKQDRKVMVLYSDSPESQETRKLIKGVLDKGRPAARAARIIAVRVMIERLDDSAVARTYRIRQLPTTVLYDSKGQEINRREGYFAEMDFPDGFLKCERVVGPPQ